MGVMTRLLLLLWAGVAVSTEVDLQKRIIGGQNCGQTERLYHVEVRGYVTFPRGRFSKCGGSLISDQWILTAEHCWNGTRTMRAVVGIHPGGRGKEEEITPHFFRDNQSRTHDIMLLQLTNPTQIQPVPLPDCLNPPNISDTVQMAGRASTTMGPNNERQRGRANILQCANIPIVDCTELRNCLQMKYPQFYMSRQYQHWQCYKEDGVDTSPGDSGGGVVFNGMIYGVHVLTGNHTHACVEPAAFTSVCGYMDWIVRTTGIPKPTPAPGTGPRPGPGHGSGSGPGPAPAPAPTPAPRSRTRSKWGCANCNIL